MSYSKKRRNTKKKNTSRKNIPRFSYETSEITVVFLEALNMVKLYHWKTHSYAEHKSTDDLYASLNTHIDTFIETLLGIEGGSRINLTNKRSLALNDFSNVNQFKQSIEVFKKYLYFMNKSRLGYHSDLMNIRDSILGDLNKLTYLLTFQ
jgi:DNA-binding ferritin-like protein